MALEIFYLLILVFILTPAHKASADYILNDKFTGTSLNSHWMALNVYDGKNDEDQCYTPSQVTVHGGYLNIKTIAQRTKCGRGVHPFDSGAVVWAPGLNFRYGTIEVRARLAGGKGTWPAIWLLGTDCQPGSPDVYNAPSCRWPKEGSNEIDIAEVQHGYLKNPYQNAFDTSGREFSCYPDATDVTRHFHTYALRWTPRSLTWYIDGARTCRQTDLDYIPFKPMYLIINTAVGGSGGGHVWKSSLPQTTKVQFVRVTPYDNNPSS